MLFALTAKYQHQNVTNYFKDTMQKTF